MKIKTICLRLLTGVLSAILLFSCASFASAAGYEKKKVRVAYFNMGYYYNELSKGYVESYDTEVLEKIEQYSNLYFEYVDCGTWSNALDMLNRHEVDLVGTMQWTSEREEEYEFCLQSYGYTVGELAGLTEKNYVYEDYQAIAESVVGCTYNYVRMNEMKDIFRKHGISPKIKTYSGQAELEKALQTGEIDLIAANSHTLRDEWTVVEKFSYSPFYFVSWNGNTQITDQIDDALITFDLREPTADDNLLKKFFPSIIGTPLTKEELNLIAQNKTYDVYFNAETKPTSWYDEKTGTLKGGLIEICRQITEITGLKLNPVPIFAGKTEIVESQIKAITVFNDVNDNLPNNSIITNPLINESFNLYYRKPKKIDLANDACSIAIVTGRENLKKYLNTTYPNSTVFEYDTPLDCLKAVNNGKVDLTYLDCRIANNTITENGLNNIHEFPIDNTQQGIALIFPCENGELLASIANKAIEQIDQNQISNLFVQYALETSEPMTWKTIISDYWGWVILVSVFVMVTLICIATMYTYAKVMKKQKDGIAKADAEKTEFFSRMSHDMRTPMNGILGMIRLSQKADSVVEIHSNMKKAESAGEYMLSLINDTLDLQRIESKKLQLEKDVVNVTDYYESIFSILRISAEQKKLDFRVKYIDIDMKNYIVLDAVRTKQILSNLVSNAIKFTPEGGTVEVTVESLGQDGNILHRKYQVKDTGVGMSDDFIKTRLFKPYSQENNELSSQLTGTGLGMAITKNLVEIMGGHLEVESELGEGTTFSAYFDIERASKETIDKEKEEKAARAKAIVTDLANKKILLCEDHPLNAEIAKKLLKNVGCEVEWAENGQIGVEKYMESEPNSYDAILMDVRMPVMDGLTATKAIRESGKADALTIPILAMTANAYNSDIKRCIESGMNAHIAKPIEPQQLYSILCYNMKNKQ